MLENTHVPTVLLGNISLTLPPETVRKAAPQNPVAKRKVKKIPAKTNTWSIRYTRGRGKSRGATNVGRKSDRKAEYKKQCE